ncbi:MAG: hypothetical protein P0Y53_10400 [Candidatus Pseudobacter hemicellulosilyticus]|uniref:Uncharacterized protein n=1 Tax=Candidatus Pseudobacter hemicellulosilyticus TaxID=3121375 RepID=A0AAJ6BJH0_9BACT|nr:MAG: hypothetical protein P0Y53_10400 [Pseudobacter sp.]
MPYSFYDLDYIIDVNERRIDQYLSAYQKVLARFTNLILIYSALMIFLIPVFEQLFLTNDKKYWLCCCFGLFSVLFGTSLFFTVRLIIPVQVYFLRTPNAYYENFRLRYERNLLHKNPTLSKPELESKVAQLLKASYINELERTLNNNESVFIRKSSFYYHALRFGLLSVLPFLICLSAYLLQKQENIHKIEIYNIEKIIKLLKMHSMSKDKNDSSSTNSQDTVNGITTNLPGVDNSLVIPSYPYMIKEGSLIIKGKNQ